MNLLFRLWPLLLLCGGGVGGHRRRRCRHRCVLLGFAGAVVFMVLFCLVLWGLLLLLVLLLIDVGIVVVVILVSGFRDFSRCYSMWVHVVACFLCTYLYHVSLHFLLSSSASSKSGAATTVIDHRSWKFWNLNTVVGGNAEERHSTRQTELMICKLEYSEWNDAANWAVEVFQWMLGFPTTAERALWSDLACSEDSEWEKKTKKGLETGLITYWLSGILSGWFQIFSYFHPYLPAEMIQFDPYFSDGLVQPPISYACFPLPCFETV